MRCRKTRIWNKEKQKPQNIFDMKRLRFCIFYNIECYNSRLSDFFVR